MQCILGKWKFVSGLEYPFLSSVSPIGSKVP
jgi:hypothetical protein